MSRKFRGFIGMLLLVALVVFWSLFFMALAQGRVQESSPATQMLYYIIAGIGWVIPAGLIIKWIGQVKH